MCLTNVWSRVQVFLPSGGKVPSRKRFLCGLVVLGLFFGVADQARSQFMYWGNTYYVAGNGGDIRRAKLDGSEQHILVTGLNAPAGPALDLAGGKMYWANLLDGQIWRAHLDGTGPETVVRQQTKPGHLALDLVGGWKPLWHR
jgi:hypothetical protein